MTLLQSIYLTVTFTVDVRDLLRLDLGRRPERRIAEFGNELANWITEKEDDGWCSIVSAILIWAAGFTAAILKKRSSTISTEPNSPINDDGTSNPQKKEPLGIENMMLSSIEKLFPILLNLPDVNMRLTKVIQRLNENHPPCPQLYLYSCGDKVVPSQSVELRIREQQKIGRNIHSFNFKSSPHVDHYRNFPDLYSSQLHNFLQECFTPTKQQAL